MHLIWEPSLIPVHSEAKHFKLYTLFCNYCLNVAGFLVNHSDVQIFGTYSNSRVIALADTLRNVLATPESRRSKPIVLSMKCDTHMPMFDNTIIFSTFLTNDLYSLKAISDTMDADVGRDMLLRKKFITGVLMYLRDFTDLDFVTHLAEETARFFPAVDTSPSPSSSGSPKR